MTEKVAFEGNVLYAGSFDHNLYALDALSGKILWRFAGSYALGSPIVYNKTIYVNSRDGKLYAITINREKKWEFVINSYLPSDPPTAKDNIIYQGAFDFNIYAISTETGKLLWRFPTQNAVISTPIVHNNTIYFGSCDGNFYALDKNGRLLWKFKTNGPIISPPTLHDNVIYFGSWDCNLYAIGIDGKLLWKFHTAMNQQAPLDIEITEEKDLQLIIKPEETESEKKKYREEETIGDYNINVSHYAVNTDYVKTKKKGYLSD
jgi:outer membrane protein assembly factor BamB